MNGAPLLSFLYIKDVGLNPVPLPECFTWNYLFHGEYGLCFSKVNYVMIFFNSLDYSCRYFTYFVFVLIVDNIAFSVPNFLDYDLFRSLCCDPAKRTCIHFYTDTVTYLTFGVMIFGVRKRDFHIILSDFLHHCFKLEHLYFTQFFVIAGL